MVCPKIHHLSDDFPSYRFLHLVLGFPLPLGIDDWFVHFQGDWRNVEFFIRQVVGGKRSLDMDFIFVDTTSGGPAIDLTNLPENVRYIHRDNTGPPGLAFLDGSVDFPKDPPNVWIVFGRQISFGQLLFLGSQQKTGWWFGTSILFSHILGIVIPIDFHIFQRGGPTTNQKTTSKDSTCVPSKSVWPCCVLGSTDTSC